MTPELRAQKTLIERLYQELELMRSKRALKSKKYRDLEARIGRESALYEAMKIALDVPKE